MNIDGIYSKESAGPLLLNPFLRRIPASYVFKQKEPVHAYALSGCVAYHLPQTIRHVPVSASRLILGIKKDMEAPFDGIATVSSDGSFPGQSEIAFHSVTACAYIHRTVLSKETCNKKRGGLTRNAMNEGNQPGTAPLDRIPFAASSSKPSQFAASKLFNSFDEVLFRFLIIRHRTTSPRCFASDLRSLVRA